jgi:5-formyltetrahydrofolate cyclo-ligase
MIKADLRKLYLQKRLSLSDAEYAHLNFQLFNMFFETIDLSFVNTLHSFLPLKQNHEPDTWNIIARVQQEFPHIKISIPRVNRSTREIENFFFEGLQQLQPDPWGIPEPTGGLSTPDDAIDIVLVPLLAFDKKGHRVGYGKGFYDKFLSRCKPTCRRIGLSLFPPIEEISDANDFDQSLNHVVTPHKRHDF